MVGIWTLVHWLHVAGAIIWLGGVFFVVFMLRPALQTVPELHVRRFVLGQTVARMRRVINVVVTTQALTGIYMIWVRLDGASGFWSGNWGGILLTKVVLASLMIALYVVVPRLLLSAPASGAAGAGGGGGGTHDCPTEMAGPPWQQKLGQILHVVLLVLGFTVVFLAKLLT